MRLLLISDPSAYRSTRTDVPLCYARLAEHPDIDLYHADSNELMRSGGRIASTAVMPGFHPSDFDSLQNAATAPVDPAEFDLAFCRTLKPYPNLYLERLIGWQDRLHFLNDPSGLKRHMDLSFFLHAAAEHAPASVVTRTMEVATEFFSTHQEIVAKRANSCGGKGVYRITPNPNGRVTVDNLLEGTHTFDSFQAAFLSLTKYGAEALLLMRFLPRVLESELRIIVVGGTILGAYVRSSVSGHWVQNVSAGSSCELCELGDREIQMVRDTCGPYLEAGINTLGYDLLRGDDGNWLISEINAGNVGGLFRLHELGMEHSTDQLIQWMIDYSLSRKKISNATHGVSPNNLALVGLS